MKHKLTIGGKEVEICWNQQTARAFTHRLQKHKVGIAFSDFRDPARAEYAYTAALWCLLPEDEFEKYKSSERLAVAIDPEIDMESIVAAVLACVSEIVVDAEKKSSSKNGLSQESN